MKDIKNAKDVKGYEGLYAVTSCGKVWSRKRCIFLKPQKNIDGYLVVGLCKNGKVKKYRVHRLVAEAYIPNPNNLPEVNHKDENKQNPCANNLEWCTRKHNVNYGNRNHYSKSSKKKPCICIELNKTFDSPLTASKEFGITYSSVAKSCRDAIKTAGGYHWKYK